MGAVPGGLRAVRTAVTVSGEPWAIGGGRVQEGAGGGVLCHECTWRVKGGGVEVSGGERSEEGEDEGCEGAHGYGWGGILSQLLRIGGAWR